MTKIELDQRQKEMNAARYAAVLRESNKVRMKAWGVLLVFLGVVLAVCGLRK